MIRHGALLSATVLSLCLASCGDDGRPTDASTSDVGTSECGPSPCGLCAPGCTNADTCTPSGWSCNCVCPDGGGLDGSGPDATSDAASDATADAVSDAAADATNPSGCPEGGASGTCEPMGLECRYGDRVCTCEPPCSGVDPGPDPPHDWACALRPRACPSATPMDGSACTDPGLSCGYGTCGGAMAVCVAGTWIVTFTPPPP